MELVLLTALGVGGATLIGAIIGFAFKKISHRFSDIIEYSLPLPPFRLKECEKRPSR